MGMRIKTNVESLSAQRQLGVNRHDMQESLNKLSSGQRINKSADDAAGLAVSEAMRAKVRGMSQAKRNANDGISYLQVAEGGLSEVNNMVVRMRELATQSASDTIGEKERGFLDKEFQQVGQELGRIVESTEFNGRRILRADEAPAEGLGIQVGASSFEEGSKANPESDVIRIKFDQLADMNSAIEAIQGLNIEGTSGDRLGGGSTSDVFKALDEGMNKVTTFRATIGAMQSRMQSAITNIDVGMENVQAAQSRIRDVDYAEETAKLTQSRILSTAGVAVLSQANALPEQVIQLLR